MKKRIMYLGGSITCGANATDYGHSWASLSFNNIAHTLYGDNAEMLNASISGTGSRVAVFRLAKDVLPYKPDLVFIEFAVNDNSIAKTDFDMVVASMEYLVRTLKAHNPNIAITFVYATNTSGENASHAHTIIAKHYGIPEIDLREAVLAKIKSGENVWEDFFDDTAHPTDFGHAFYADIVTRSVFANPERFMAPVKDADPIAPFSYRHPRIVHPSEAIAMHGFEIKETVENTKLKHLPELVVHDGAFSNCVGSSLTFEFEGNHLGIYVRIGNFGGRIRVTVDDKICGDIECYYQYGDGTDNIGEHISQFYVRSLQDGKHTATLTSIESHPDSKGNEISIAAFFID